MHAILASLAPVATWGWGSVTALIALMTRGGDRVRRRLQTWRFNNEIPSSRPPAAWPAALVAEAEAEVDALTQPDAPIPPLGPAVAHWARLLLFYRYTGTGDNASIDLRLRPFAALPRAVRSDQIGSSDTIDLLLATHLALPHGDDAAAEVLIDRVPPTSPEQTGSLVPGAEAAHALAAGQPAASAISAREALHRLDRFGLNSGADATERRWLHDILARTHSRSPSPNSSRPTP